VNEVLKHADMAMYQAKFSGRSRYHIFAEDLLTRAKEHARLEAGMRRALQQKEFVLYYQPQLHLRTGRIVGVEALIRWNHPESGLLTPATFLHVAEESGLIAEITAWVIREACEQLAKWQNQSICGLRLAINISPSQFNSAKTWDTLADALTRTPIDPASLELELTESVFAGQVEVAALNIKRLKKIGISVALDDFGTGFSSLLLAKELPVDAIKIDRGFVKNLPWSKEDSAITQAVIRLAHGLDLRVVAEGVENQEQLAYLLKEGCDEIQGYYISRAVPAEECLEIILRQGSWGTAT
jgi:EAL domain-containing protein (putative c-di-GMP-specific phosphodiesterase class I)